MSRDEVFEKMLELLRQQLGDPQLDITQSHRYMMI